MSQNIVLESNFIKEYITKNKQQRYLSLIANGEKRKKFIAELAHLKSLNFPKFDKLHATIESAVKQRIGSIKDCYVISENKMIDTKRIQVDLALSQVIGYGMGTLLIFGDGDVVYYEGEEINDRWLSKIVKP